MPLARVLVPFQYTLIGNESSVDENGNRFCSTLKYIDACLGGCT